MFIPDGPLWCWNMQGADVLFLSQPTVYWSGGKTFQMPVAGPCAARCQFESWCEEPDGSVRTHPIQCGRLALLLPDGTYRCFLHTGEDWGCAWCDEYKARGDHRSCPGCHATWRESGLPDFCCGPEGTPWP